MRKDPHHPLYSWPSRAVSRVGWLFSNSNPGRILKLFLSAVSIFFESVDKQHRATNQQLLNQIYFTGFQAIPLIAGIAAVFGTVVMVQALTVMPKVGFGGFFGQLMVVVVVRELGPVLTAFLVAGRTGSALATYIGNMKVESEIDALESLGIPALRFLVMPAVIGAMVSLVCLNAIFSAMAIGAGFLFAKLSFVLLGVQAQMDLAAFESAIFGAMSLTDVGMMFLKPLVFGVIISTMACYHGLRLTNDARLVPVAASNSVVSSYMLIIMADLLLTAFYLPEYIDQIGRMI